tara:strand:- start:2303 stop:2671 length:369 start_codon:yes stop_codon:yes gene_type:complete
MGLKSRQKGKRGERAWVRFLREEGGLDARRGLSQSGGAIEPDVVCSDVDFLHFEVKVGKRQPNLSDAMSQAKRDAGQKVPVVAHKKDFDGWMITLPAEEFLSLILGDLPDEKETPKEGSRND